MAGKSSEKQSGTLTLGNFLKGILPISWRLPSITLSLLKALGLKDEDRMSLGTVLETNAETYGDSPALFYEDITYTHREFNESINRYAHFFLGEDVKKGDDVMVLMDNRPELLMVIGALSKLGTCASLINPNLRGDVLTYSINLTRGGHFIVGEEHLEAFETVRPDLHLVAQDKLYYQQEGGQKAVPGGYRPLKDALADQPVSNPTTTGDVALGDRFAYVFTSGTTGMPKAAIQTYRRWFSSQLWFGKIVMNLKPTDIHYCTLPFCHTNALNVSWGSAAGAGAALAIRRKFSASSFLADVRKFNANSFIYIGEICRYLMNQPEKPDDADNPLVACVGNGLRPDIWRAFKKRFGIKKVFELYGAAEGTLIFTNLLNIDCTVGMCLTPHAIVKYNGEADEAILDDAGFMQPVAKGEVGLMLAKISDALPFAGYTDRKETEKKILRDVFETGDAWFNFGDLVLNQGYKHIQFVDRIGDTFRWKGENVSTGEVEKVINTHDQIAESTVYGVKIPGTDGRAGMAAIIPTTAWEAFDLDSLADIVADGLPSYAVPKFIRFMKVFETTGTHKIKKVVLREESFDLEKVEDPVFVLLPKSREYVRLTMELLKDISNETYRF